MLINRNIRNQIAQRSCSETVEELRRWTNDGPVSLADYGVPVSAQEEALQADMLELMAAEEYAA